MKKLVSSLAVLVLALSLLSTGLASARSKHGSFSFTGVGCQEAGSFFLLDPEVVRPFVPERFEIGLINSTPPVAELVVLTTTCEDLSVDGRSGAGFFSEVGVYIQNVDESPGNWHYYGLWNAGTYGELSKSLSRLGVTAPLVKDASYSSTTGTADAAASVPWKKGPYEVTVASPAPTSLFEVRPSVWWYSDGNDGYVRVVYSREQTGATRSGTAVIETAADSALGVMLGGATRHADTSMIADYERLQAAVSRVKL